jgi:class 3 adenylate cyclase
MISEQRRLAAILVADVVGYSKLVGSDEAGTLAQLQTLRMEVIEPQIATLDGCSSLWVTASSSSSPALFRR